MYTDGLICIPQICDKLERQSHSKMALFLPGFEVTGFVVTGFVVTGEGVVVIGFGVVVGAFCDPTAYVAQKSSGKYFSAYPNTVVEQSTDVAPHARQVGSANEYRQRTYRKF